MRARRDSTVRGVVLSLLSAIVLLIPLSVALNRLSFGPSSNQGFNLAEVFSSPPGTKPLETVASTPPFSSDISKNSSFEADSEDVISRDFSSPEYDDPISQDPVTESSAYAPSPDDSQTASDFSQPEYDDSRFPDFELDSSDIAPSPSENIATKSEDLDAEYSDSPTAHWVENADVSSPEGGVESAGNGTSFVEPDESYVSSFFDAEVQRPDSVPTAREEEDPADTESLLSNSTQPVEEPPAQVEFERSWENVDDLTDPDSEVSAEVKNPDSTELFAASPLPGPSDEVGYPTGAPSSLTSAILEPGPTNRSEANRQRAFRPTSVPHYSFVQFSAYRQSVHTFFVTGISSHVARTFDYDKIAHTCEWHPANGTVPLSVHSDPKKFVETEARMIYIKSDENSGTYSPTIINCTFAKPVGANRKGGLLVLRISTGYGRSDLNNLPVVAMEELAGEVDIVMTPPEKLPFKYAFCGAPMHGKLSAEWILQWMTYHHYLAQGRGHFFFYNLVGLAELDKPQFQQFLDAGLLSITDILDPTLTSDYPTWYYHQVLFINDCLHRSRFMAEHVFFIDYDEFVQIPAPDTLARFMKRHKDQPWISLGSIPANTQDCRSPPGETEQPLERMLWRRQQPGCKLKPEEADPWLCIGPVGRRKYVVNPRYTFAVGVHWVTIPKKGLNLKAQEARIVHYRGSQQLDNPVCSVEVREGSLEEQAVLQNGWVRDESVAMVYAKAKSFLNMS
ncbi:hypothetical protein M758_8G043200 [Ceratodon purpureus]|nr:hypothetical protein M758_8G043200 [Ceratodon purpureus]